MYVLCNCNWHRERKLYLDECNVPNIDTAGKWQVQVKLNGEIFYSGHVHMQCRNAFFEDASGACVACAEGMICDSPGTELETVVLKAGRYRDSTSAAVVRTCPFGEAACPSDTGQECATGYEGPLCASCSRGARRVNAPPEGTCTKRC